ncbi:8397_t:CDS:2, partial [Ambispora leptoticha]
KTNLIKRGGDESPCKCDGKDKRGLIKRGGQEDDCCKPPPPPCCTVTVCKTKVVTVDDCCVTVCKTKSIPCFVTSKVTTCCETKPTGGHEDGHPPKDDKPAGDPPADPPATPAPTTPPAPTKT